MRRCMFAVGLFFIFIYAAFGQNTTPPNAQTQQSATNAQTPAAPESPRAALTEAARAYDAQGRVALGGVLRTTALAGTPEAPVRNARFVIENRTGVFLTYASGFVTFYDAAGVRCGEGLFKLDALAPNESAETDAPDLRVTATPATWRITASALLTKTQGDLATPPAPTPPPTPTPSPTPAPSLSATPTPPASNAVPPTAQSSAPPAAPAQTSAWKGAHSFDSSNVAASKSTRTRIAASARGARMFQGLRTVIYHVSDLQKAKQWYAQALGVEPYFEQTFYVGFNVGGFELGLDPDTSNVTTGSNVVAYWGVADAAAALRRLVELGATRREDVRDVGEGIRVATVTDPFGNIFGVIENPHFKSHN